MVLRTTQKFVNWVSGLVFLGRSRDAGFPLGIYSRPFHSLDEPFGFCI